MSTTTKGGLTPSAILVFTLALAAGSAAAQSDKSAAPGVKARPAMGLADGLASPVRKQPELTPGESEVIDEMRRLNRLGMDQVKTGVLSPRPSLALPTNEGPMEKGKPVPSTEPSEGMIDGQPPALKLPALLAERADQAPAAKTAVTDAGFDLEAFNRSQVNLVGLLLGGDAAPDGGAEDVPARTRSMGASRTPGARPVADGLVDTGAATVN